LAKEKSGPIRRRRDGEGACLSRGTGSGGQQPQGEACSKTGMYGRNGPMSERRRGGMGW